MGGADLEIKWMKIEKKLRKLRRLREVEATASDFDNVLVKVILGWPFRWYKSPDLYQHFRVSDARATRKY
jgi:hypothetical protein